MGALDGDDRLIAALALAQHGVVARRQLLAAGITRRQIARRLEAGRLHRLHPGVYAVGHTALAPEGIWLAAVLACGAGAALSNLSAGALRGLCRDGPQPSVTTSRGLRTPGVKTHRARLVAADVTMHRGIPVTSVARTLVDLSHALDLRSLDRAVREAMFQGWWDDRAVLDALSRRPSRRLARFVGDDGATQSRLEDLFLRICDRHGIPRPRTQQGVKPRVDFVWAEQGVVVEVDGWRAHRTRHAFQRDRETTNALQLAGYVVLRFTYGDLTRRPADVAGQVRRALRPVSA